MHRRNGGLTAVLGVLCAVLAVGAVPASAAGLAQSSIASPVPSSSTPNIVDGRVMDMERVGNRIVVAGTFTQVQDTAANGGATWSRTSVFAFDPSTGAVDPSFAPVVNGTVNAVAAGTTPGTVLLAGQFSQINGATARNLALLNLVDGTRVTTFAPPAINGAINDVEVYGSRVFIGGVFTSIGGVTHGGLATVSAANGSLDPYLSLDTAGHHNSGTAVAPVGVSNLDISSDGTRLVAIGNFKTVEGLSRDQLALVDLQATTAVVDPGWYTNSYQPACNSSAFDSYVRDVQWSPDGTYFVVAATGGYYPGTLCDAAARFDLAANSTLPVVPTWSDLTGGDTLHSVAISGAAVYVGGHERWLNNPSASDKAGPGAVPRPGIAALDPLNGVPLTWNPGRSPRGIGAQSLLLTAGGLYVGSDTNYIGNYKYLRKKIAFFPLSANPMVSQSTGQLPGIVYLAGRAAAGGGADDVLSRSFDGTTAGPDTAAPSGGVAWSQARGAFMAGNTLFYGYPDSSGIWELVRQTFDGSSFGSPQLLDTPYHDPYWDGVNTGSGNTYDGAFPDFYGTELQAVTGMFYANGRIYYAKSGSSSLFSRAFSIDSGITGAIRTTVVGSGFGKAGGMFLNGNTLYVVDRTNGNLTKMSFVNGKPSGTATLVSGPVDGHDWRATALFLHP